MFFRLRGVARPPLVVAARGRRATASARRGFPLQRPPPPGALAVGARSGGYASASSASAPSASSGYPERGPSDPAEREALVVKIAERLKADPALCNRVGLTIDDHTATRLSSPWTSAEVPRPAMGQLGSVCVRNAVPFVGFGFFDNMIMLTTGEAIDETFGVAFGFSTLAAAGMGQMVSDASGITLQGLIERFADSLGLPDPGLTREQQTSNLVQWIVLFSRVIGIIFGCFMGMFPLLLMPNKEPRFVDYVDSDGTLSASARRELMQLVETRTYKAGDIMIPMGELIDHMYLIQSGNVRVVGHDHTLLNKPFTVTVLEPGQVFGEPKLFAPSPCALVAEDHVRVQVVRKDELLRITGQHAAMQVFEAHRNKSIHVYVKAHGPVLTGTPQAVQGTGKVRFFGSLPTAEKLNLLRITGKDQALWGSTDDEMTLFFCSLTQVERTDTIAQWQHDSRARERRHGHAAPLPDSLARQSALHFAAGNVRPLKEPTPPTRPSESGPLVPAAPPPPAATPGRETPERSL